MSPRHEPDPWFDLPLEERQAQYAKRKTALDELIVMVRMHRADDCIGAPLCPGREVSDRLSGIRPWEIGEFVATCLAHIADDQEEIENLRAERDQVRDRLRAAEQTAARRKQELIKAVQDGDAGWEAYRREHDRRAAEVDRPWDTQ